MDQKRDFFHPSYEQENSIQQAPVTPANHVPGGQVPDPGTGGAPARNNNGIKAAIIIAVAIVVAAAIVGGVLYWIHRKEEQQKQMVKVTVDTFHSYEKELDKIEEKLVTTDKKTFEKSKKEALESEYEYVVKCNKKKKAFKSVKKEYNPCRLVCTYDNDYVYYHCVYEESCVLDDKGETLETAQQEPVQFVAEQEEPQEEPKKESLVEKLVSDGWRMEPERGGVIYRFFNDGGYTVEASGKWESGSYSNVTETYWKADDEAQTVTISGYDGNGEKYAATIYNIDCENALLMIEHGEDVHTSRVLFRDSAINYELDFSDFEGVAEKTVQSEKIGPVSLIEKFDGGKSQNEQYLTLENEGTMLYYAYGIFVEGITQFREEGQIGGGNTILLEKTAETTFNAYFLEVDEDGKGILSVEEWTFE